MTCKNISGQAIVCTSGPPELTIEWHNVDLTYCGKGRRRCGRFADRRQKAGKRYSPKTPKSLMCGTDQTRLQIEFPSILLPPSISSGSIVDITVSRNLKSEAASQKAFSSLQSSILDTFGVSSPSPPVLRCRNATQTSIVLEWDPIDLATAELRSLSLYRNGSKAGAIPRPMEITSTKISGLAVDTEYTFYLVLKTSGGTYSSEKLAVRTHKMTDLSGITITPGILPAPLRESLSGAVDRIGAKIAENVRIDTTHFVCIEGRGREWEKAVEMNIPVVRPEWIEGCEREGRIVGVRGYYLNADPRLRQVGQGVGVQNQQPPGHSRTDSQSTLPHRPQQQNPLQQNPPSSAALETNRPPQPASPADPAPTPPAKDTPMPERASPPGSPSTVESIDSTSQQNPHVAVTSPSEPDHEQETYDKGGQDIQNEREPKSPGDTSFTDITL